VKICDRILASPEGKKYERTRSIFMPIDCASIAAFGKIIFIPVNENVPSLPKMNLLFFNDKERGEIYPWRAACIDLELDAAGDTMDDAWDNLKKTLTMYIDMQKKAANGSIIEAARIIIQEAFSDSAQKQEYFSIYRQVKLNYAMKNIETDTFTDPISKEKHKIELLEAEKDSIRRVINNVDEELDKAA